MAFDPGLLTPRLVLQPTLLAELSVAVMPYWSLHAGLKREDLKTAQMKSG